MVPVALVPVVTGRAASVRTLAVPLGLLAGLAGALQLPREPATLEMDMTTIGAAFVVVVVGGMGSVRGAVAGAIIGNNVGGGNAATGAAIGALAGGAAGPVVGRTVLRRPRDLWRLSVGSAACLADGTGQGAAVLHPPDLYRPAPQGRGLRAGA